MTKNDDIEACVKALMQVCTQNSVPVIIALQESKGSFRTISKKGEMEGDDRLRLVKLALRHGEVDLLMKAIIADAQSNGHNSLYLKAMGIPSSPF